QYFGELTRQAVMKYQREKGVSPASGYFGPKTRAVLNAEQKRRTQTKSVTSYRDDADFREYTKDIFSPDFLMRDEEFQGYLRSKFSFVDVEYQKEAINKAMSECLVESIDGSVSEKAGASIIEKTEKEDYREKQSKVGDFVDNILEISDLDRDGFTFMLDECVVLSFEEATDYSFREYNDLDFKKEAYEIVYKEVKDNFGTYFQRELGSLSPSSEEEVAGEFSKCIVSEVNENTPEKLKVYLMEAMEEKEFENDGEKIFFLIQYNESFHHRCFNEVVEGRSEREEDEDDFSDKEKEEMSWDERYDPELFGGDRDMKIIDEEPFVGTEADEVLIGDIDKANTLDASAGGDNILWARGRGKEDTMIGGPGDDDFVIVGDLTPYNKPDSPEMTALLGRPISDINGYDFNEDADGGEIVIDGGGGNDTLYITGDADISNFKISNVEELEIY
ncbi:MAG: peptidoglycan-binding domain-containing protein, partial [Patescibacteria group bacterium]